MLNRITIMGRLTGDPVMRYTQSQTPVASFSLAVERDFGNRETGDREVDFINCVAWRNTADFVRQFMHKGDLVVVDGEIQTRSYEAQDGSKRYVTEINAEDVRRPIQRAAAQSGGRIHIVRNRRQSRELFVIRTSVKTANTDIFLIFTPSL